MTPDQALTLMQDVLDGLHRSGLVEEPVAVSDESVLLGAGSDLDSLELVTLISELEERISRETGADTLLMLTDIHEFNSDSLALTAATLARYISRQTAG